MRVGELVEPATVTAPPDPAWLTLAMIVVNLQQNTSSLDSEFRRKLGRHLDSLFRQRSGPLQLLVLTEPSSRGAAATFFARYLARRYNASP